MWLQNILDSTYFPAAHSEKEAHHIGLLLLLKFLDILEGTHLGCSGNNVSSNKSVIRVDKKISSSLVEVVIEGFIGVDEPVCEARFLLVG